jgi:hypothetical protein
MTGEIELSRGYVAIVDEEDHEWLSEWKWCANSKKGNAYAFRTVGHGGKRIGIYLHRLVLGIDGTEAVADHINGDTLDNRRANLRVVNHWQNAVNAKMYANNTSGVKGVDFVKQRGQYRARIFRYHKQITVGYSGTLRGAAALRREAEKELYGEYVRATCGPGEAAA